MIFLAVPAVGDRAGAVDHRRNQIVFLECWPILRLDQVDRTQPHFGCIAAEIVNAHLLVAPARDGLLNASFWDASLGHISSQSGSGGYLDGGSSCHEPP